MTGTLRHGFLRIATVRRRCGRSAAPREARPQGPLAHHVMRQGRRPVEGSYWAAGHFRPPVGDRRFAVANGVFASAVISHFTSWPRTTRAGLPCLTRCEGLEGRLMGPYNALLHVSAVAAVGGAVENRRAWLWFAPTPLIVVPLLRRQTPREYH